MSVQSKNIGPRGAQSHPIMMMPEQPAIAHTSPRRTRTHAEIAKEKIEKKLEYKGICFTDRTTRTAAAASQTCPSSSNVALVMGGDLRVDVDDDFSKPNITCSSSSRSPGLASEVAVTAESAENADTTAEISETAGIAETVTGVTTRAATTTTTGTAGTGQRQPQLQVYAEDDSGDFKDENLPRRPTATASASATASSILIAGCRGVSQSNDRSLAAACVRLRRQANDDRYVYEPDGHGRVSRTQSPSASTRSISGIDVQEDGEDEEGASACVLLCV